MSAEQVITVNNRNVVVEDNLLPSAINEEPESVETLGTDFEFTIEDKF